GIYDPFQKDRIQLVKAYCLDATYSISKSSDDIMYTIVIRDDNLDRGFPCSYMITNNHSVGPIVQWLQFLKESNLIINPL
ncbi:MAG: hypothetical protein EXX96DRAFT_488370, partial [Benjaminiella poitrasii]